MYMKIDKGVFTVKGEAKNDDSGTRDAARVTPENRVCLSERW